MLEVTVRLLPFGDPARAQVLGTMLIVNDGTGDAERANYLYTVVDATDEHEGRVTGHHRRTGFWNLVRICLEAVIWRD